MKIALFSYKIQSDKRAVFSGSLKLEPEIRYHNRRYVL